MRYLFRARAFATCALAVWLVLPASASAQDQIDARPAAFRTAVLDALQIPVPAEAPRASVRTGVPERDVRPPALLPLYATLGVLQALDVHSTSRGLASGGREANPVMESVVRNRVAFIGVKAATTAGVVWASERLWRKQNRKAAVVLTALTNIGLAAVVAHNYRVAR